MKQVNSFIIAVLLIYCGCTQYILHTDDSWPGLALDEHVGGTAHNCAGVVQHSNVVVHQVLPAVGPADIETETGSLYVEAVQHEDRRQDVSIQLLKYFC